MTCKSTQLPLSQLISARNHNNWNIPDYQRDGDLWDTSAKRLLIDSILHHMDIPKFYIAKEAEGSDTDWNIVDGQQRTCAIMDFINDKYALDKKCGPIRAYNVDYDVAGKKYSQLHQDVKELINGFVITVVEVYGDVNYQKELFVRLQNGKNMTTAEKLNAEPYTNIPTILSLLAKDYSTDLLSLSIDKKGNPNWNNRRMCHQQLLAKMLANYLDVPSTKINSLRQELYQKYKDLTDKDDIICKFKRTLPYAFECIQFVNDLNLNTGAWFFIYAILNHFRKYKMNYDKISMKNCLYDFFKRFSMGNASDPCTRFNLFTATMSTDGELRTGGMEDKSGIERVINAFLDNYLDKINVCTNDPCRLFNDDVKTKVFIKQDCKCADCKQVFALSKLIAHHIVPWAKGGKTIESNCAMLCESCHQKRHGC